MNTAHLKSWLLAGAVLVVAVAARAEFPTTRPYEEVTFQHETRKNPDLSMYVVSVDLSDPDVKVRITQAGEDPDGPGRWETTLMPVKQIAEREKLDIAVNASFFSVPTSQEAPDLKPGYVVGKPAAPVKNPNWPVVWVEADRKVGIGARADVPKGARQLVAGNCYVLKDGVIVEPAGRVMQVRHPRTVVGVNQQGSRLVLLTVDGRRPGVSNGMTGPDLGAEMLRLGCWNALNLDGGGSTTLVMRDPATGEVKVLNQPSDGRERPVADVVGVIIKR